MSDSVQSDDVSPTGRSQLSWEVTGLVVAIAGAGGSLWLSIGMGLKACPLCLYQRTFLLSVVGILAVGLQTEARRTGLLNVLAIPASMGGFGVAIFHEYLELTGALECPAGIFGLGTAPQQSLVLFAVLVAILAVPVLRNNQAPRWAATATGVIVGLLLAFGTIRSAPPMPAPPESPYEQPLEVCRPPYVAGLSKNSLDEVGSHVPGSIESSASFSISADRKREVAVR